MWLCRYCCAGHRDSTPCRVEIEGEQKSYNVMGTYNVSRVPS